MNNKIILATSGMADAENLLTVIEDLIADTKPLLIEASIFSEQTISAFPDIRTMQEARDLAFYNTDHFEKVCARRKIKFARRPHYDNYFVRDLIDDSRFADLIVCYRSFLSNGQANSINEGVQATLRKLECPVIVLPDNLKSLMPYDLFVFDGTADAIMAIKTFTYLFPNRCNKEILMFNTSLTSGEISETTAWISAHYNSFRWIKELPMEGQYNLICGRIDKSTLISPIFVFHA